MGRSRAAVFRDASYGRERLSKWESESHTWVRTRQEVDIRFSANVAGPANETSVFIYAVSTERESASVDGLRDKMSWGPATFEWVGELTSGTIRELVYPPDEGK